MDSGITPARGGPLSLDRALFLLVPTVLAWCLVFPSTALPQDERAKLERPASYEHAAGATCIVREETPQGAMPAFHVYLVLDYEDGHSWSTQEAIVPIDLELARNVRDRWERRTKARNKAFKYCDAWDLEVAVELDKISKSKAQKENAPVLQRTSIR
jgi:hypothetical protein